MLFFFSISLGRDGGGNRFVFNPRKSPCRFRSGDTAKGAGDKLKRETWSLESRKMEKRETEEEEEVLAWWKAQRDGTKHTGGKMF